MSPILQNVMNRQIHQPYIKRPLFRHERMSKMVNGRILLVITLIIEIIIMKETIRLRDSFVFFIKSTIIETLEKCRIYFGNLICK